MRLPTPFPSARILVAEDDPVQAALICDLLQNHFEALEDFAVGKPDDSIARFVEIRRAGLIIFRLLCV